MKKTIWMFAGQGSQYYRMGAELLERESVFKEELVRGDRLVQKLINESLLEIIYRAGRNRFEPFNRTLYSHPAILLVECAVARLLLSRGLKPDLVLGYSLGEFASMVVAESISFEEALVTVVKQAELLEYCAPAGGMMAVLDSADLADRFPEAFEGCEISGHNFARSFQVSAPAGPLARLQRLLKEKGINWLELPVSHGFHSRSMDAIKTPFKSVLKKLAVAPPKIPVISAERRGRLEDFSVEHFWAATRHPIDFAQTIRDLETSGPYRYVDLGPSGSMATAVKYNLGAGSGSDFLSLITPFGQESKNLARLIEKCAGPERSP
ncbi:MAG: acyltransferase domain-containing protein [Limisphaerales bacterium]